MAAGKERLWIKHGGNDEAVEQAAVEALDGVLGGDDCLELDEEMAVAEGVQEDVDDGAEGGALLPHVLLDLGGQQRVEQRRGEQVAEEDRAGRLEGHQIGDHSGKTSMRGKRREVLRWCLREG